METKISGNRNSNVLKDIDGSCRNEILDSKEKNLEKKINRFQTLAKKLRKNSSLYFSSKRDRFQFVDDHRVDFPLTTLIRVLKVSRSAYYSWKKAPDCRRKKENKFLLNQIRVIYFLNGGKYGSPRIHRELLESGIQCGHNRVANLMKLDGLKSNRRNGTILSIKSSRREPEYKLEGEKKQAIV